MLPGFRRPREEPRAHVHVGRQVRRPAFVRTGEGARATETSRKNHDAALTPGARGASREQP